MTQLVYLPVGLDLARRLRSGAASGPWLGFTAGAGLRTWLGADNPAPDDDEAEYAALNAAGVAHLVDPAATGPRLVLAVDVAEAVLSDPDASAPGSVTVAECGWAQVTALFADEPDAAEAVAAARSAVRGRSITDALEDPQLIDLLEQHDLLWYAPDELDALT